MVNEPDTDRATSAWAQDERENVMHRITIIGVLFAFSSVSVLAENEKVFFGILHSHTGYSDGTGLPPEAYQRARQQGHCDFFAITEHSHAVGIKPKHDPGEAAPDPNQIIALSHDNYNGSPDSLVAAAAAATVPGKFVALYGQEYSTISSGNHMNVFDVPNVITAQSGKFNQLVDFLHKSENQDSSNQVAMVQFNHPSGSLRKKGVEYGADDFSSRQAWFDAISPLACTIEILNGPGLSKVDEQEIPNDFESSYRDYLAQGFRLAPTADHDNHHRTWGTLTTARTGIIADELTKPKLLAAIRARHVYATSDNNLRVIAHVNDGLAGDILAQPAAGSELSIHVDLHDDDEPSAQYEIDVFSGVIGQATAKVVETVPAANGDGSYTIEDIHFNGQGQYIFFKIHQTNEDAEEDVAWTAPVWFGAPAPAPTNPGTPTPPADDSKIVASKNSAVYHTNPKCPSAQSIKATNRITGPAAKNGRTPHDCPPVSP